ncbi:Cysteine desulfurase [Serratia quinivorans]|uniref:aminotransferase class V-fold PLP-dependent enzyme n=1 Tax=Serratia quinivorans TaxID=137545 RepID=UPI00217774E9|nr:aminotransferase class V-fold PLP-dependent enzyme [Serratia quinivorans]CAI1739054.1 Cysteine desulfurase [Serratia quinivorans]
MDIQQVRQDTPLCEQYAYFDTGAAAPPPLPVLNAVKDYLDLTAYQGPYLPSLRQRIYAQLEEIRQQAADFLHANVNEIAFTRNGSEGISLIAQGITWQAGDEIIVPDTEILSNISPWLRLQQRYGVNVVTAKANEEGVLELEHIASLITHKTRLLTFCSLSNASGAIQPVQALCALARQHGVLSLVNASQSLGLLAADVKALGCDFLAACGRKGLRAIEGTGILYVREEHITQLEPCLVGWWNSSFDAQGQLILPATAKRFEAGCPNVPGILSMGAAITYAQHQGMAAIEQRVRALTHYAVSQLSMLPGMQIYGPKAASQRMGLVPFNLAGRDPNELVTLLATQGVIIEAGHFMAHAIMKRYGIERMARISLNYFNTEDEIDRAAALLGAN